MWNGIVKILKLMKSKFVWYLNVSGTVDSSVVRIVIVLAYWVLGRMFGTGEREAERYVTGIVCWQQNVLGWLDEWWEGKGMGELCVDSRLFYGDCMNGGKGRDWGNCVLTADCFMVIVWMVGREGSGGIVCWQQNVLWWLDEWWEGKGMGELCVDSRIC